MNEYLGLLCHKLLHLNGFLYCEFRLAILSVITEDCYALSYYIHVIWD